MVVARTGRTAILLWDAYRFLKDRTSATGSQSDAERAIESAAFGELVAKIPGLPRSTTIRLVVLVRKPVDGDNLIYRNTTFSDTTTLLTMEAPRATALKDRAAWTKELAAGHTPRGLVVTWQNHLAASP